MYIYNWFIKIDCLFRSSDNITNRIVDLTIISQPYLFMIIYYSIDKENKYSDTYICISITYLFCLSIV